MKEYAGAVADLDEVIAKPAPSVRVWFLRAEIKELDKKPDEAKIDLAEAKNIQPLDELDWSTRGYAIVWTTEKAGRGSQGLLDEADVLP